MDILDSAQTLELPQNQVAPMQAAPLTLGVGTNFPFT